MTGEQLPSGPESRRRLLWVLVAIGAVVVVGAAATAYVINRRDETSRMSAPAPPRRCAPPYERVREVDQTPTALPGSELDESQSAQLSQIAREVEEIRGLTFKEPVRSVVITREQLKEWLAAERERDADAKAELSRTAEQLKFMGQIPVDMDLAAEVQETFGEGVVGLYVEETRQLAIVGDPGALFGFGRRAIAAHELMHALDDQHFDLRAIKRRLRGPANSDARPAFTAFIEGEATLLTLEYVKRQTGVSPPSLGSIDIDDLLSRDPGEIPRVIRDELVLWYLHGGRFVEAVNSRGGWGAIDDVYRNLPAGTEQILEPNKYFSGEKPSDVPPPAVLSALEKDLGETWFPVGEGVLGAAATKIYLTAYLDTATVAGAVDAWGGSYYKYIGCDDRRAFALVVLGDDEAGAEKLESAWRAYAEAWSPPAGLDLGGVVDTTPTASRVVERSGNRVKVILANRPGLAEMVATKL